MKKNLVLLLALVGLCVSLNAQAKVKYGHVNTGEILRVMPGVDSIQIKLMAFQKELEGIYESMIAEYQAKKEKFDKEAGTMSSSVRQVREQELLAIQNRVQEFQSNAPGDVEEKQYELAEPFQTKIQNAIKEVAKEHQFAYVFDTQILLYSDGGEDLTALVKKKLGITK